jgi:predicted amidophosphoribosyltransferase
LPRLIKEPICPHCGAKLPEPKPRSCPQCAGSLQQRYLKAGCLSSAPKLIAVSVAVGWLLRELARFV